MVSVTENDKEIVRTRDPECLVSKDDLPDNMNDFAWAGSIFSKIINKYKGLTIIYFISMFFVGAGASGIIYLLETYWWPALGLTPFPFWTLGMMIWLWSFVGIPLIYQIWLTREAFLIRLDNNNEFILDPQKWFKKDYNRFDLNLGKYNKKSSRILWLWEFKTGQFKPLNRQDVKINTPSISSGKATPNSADMAGIISYKETMSKYAGMKVISKQQVIQYSIFAIILGIEVAASLFFQSRLSGG